MRILLYVLSIIVANIITDKIHPIEIWKFIIPTGSILIGLNLVLRCLVQNKYGRKAAYGVIALALVASAITSFILGDSEWIVFASALSFAVSETTDTEIYTRLKLSMPLRVLYSGIVGGILDSSVFVIVALSPIGTSILPWFAVPMAILGQILIKSLMQLVGAITVKYIEKLQ
jgi:uncharacterized PurR-regulated membrane protein YhhQ (DUF165 family)